MKRFIPYPSDARVGTSGLATVRRLMIDGVWQVPPDQRPKVADAPQPVSRREPEKPFEMKGKSIGHLRRTER